MSVTPASKSKFDQLRDRVVEIHNMMYGARSWKSHMSDRVGHTHEVLCVLVQEQKIAPFHPTVPVVLGETEEDEKNESVSPPVIRSPLSSKMKDSHKMLCKLKGIIIGESTSVITGGVDSMIHECDVIIAFLRSAPQPKQSSCVIV